MDAATIAAIGAMMTPPALVIVAVLQLRAVGRVHDEVRTGNGKTGAKLLELQEGRRIVADVPHEDRTTEEQHYVDELGDTPGS